MDTEWIKQKAVLDIEKNRRTLDIGAGKLEWPAHIIHHFRQRECSWIDNDFTGIFDLEVPPTALLQDSLDRMIRNETILLKCGFAFCHENDQYCKKTGREIARSKFDYYHFKVTSIDRCGRENCTQLYLEFSDFNKRTNSSFKRLIGFTFTLKFYGNGRICLC